MKHDEARWTKEYYFYRGRDDKIVEMLAAKIRGDFTVWEHL